MDFAVFEAILYPALTEIETRTCIRFSYRTAENRTLDPIVNLRIPGDGQCNSYIGWARSQDQVLNLGYGCHFYLRVVHEWIHAVGFAHQHTRFDRDQFVKINIENVNSSK